MTIFTPTKVFQFTSKVPEGDRHDAQFADHAKAITSTQDALSDIRRSDGQLKNHVVTKESLHPDLVDQITAAYRQSIEFNATSALASAQVAVQSRLDAQNHAQNALVASLNAQAAAAQVTGGAGSALQAVQNALQSAQSLQTAFDQRAVTFDNAENHALGAAAVAEEWAKVSHAWAEHMPGTIPPNILAIMGITGDHWSSRWWANYCAQLVSGVQPAVDALWDFNRRYLGASTSDPTLDGNGDPVSVGAMYFNSLDFTMYVFNGTGWQSLTGGGGGGGGTITGGESLGNANAIFVQEMFGVLQFRSLRFTSEFSVTVTPTELQVAINQINWNRIASTPTTLGGYGITDAYTRAQTDTLIAGRAPLTHGHQISEVAGLQSALDGKASAAHGHQISDVAGLQTQLDARAPLASPTFTGNPTAPTPTLNTSNTSIATTAFVKDQGYATQVAVDAEDAALQAEIDALELVVAGKADTAFVNATFYPRAGGPIDGPTSAKTTDRGSLTGTVVLDFGSSDNHTFTLSANATLGVPINALRGQSGVIYIATAGALALAFNGVWKWENGTPPTLSQGAGAMDALVYDVIVASGGVPSQITARLVKDVR